MTFAGGAGEAGWTAGSSMKPASLGIMGSLIRAQNSVRNRLQAVSILKTDPEAVRFTRSLGKVFAMASADIPAVGARSRLVTARNLRIAAAGTLGLLWLVVATGALVRLTASGLGCPHWPTCEANQVLPADSRHALIEFSNRADLGPGHAGGRRHRLGLLQAARLGRHDRAGAMAAAGTVARCHSARSPSPST